ncbi:type II CAAX prenyl endopeptidase Rce1 family protein [Bifidobacterium santillanense]|nr:CPBP family intramembrane glutamic endopeptidase [Bifidobacterium santillanense]
MSAPPQDPRTAWRRRLRRMVNRPVGLSLAYELVVNAGVIVAMVVVMATVAVTDHGVRVNLGGSSADDVVNRWTGVMSLFSVLCAFGFLLLMRRRDILTREFWLGGAHVDRYGEPERIGRVSRYGGARMRPLWFLVFVALCLGVQGATILIQMGFSAIGIDLVSPTLDDISASATTVSMWLYIGLVGPICEEVMFRGVLMKELKPLGRDFAILTSALLFGLFHGDVVQGVFAFLLGLVLGFVAMEYSLVWAIALHVFNNAILSGVIDGLASHYLGDTGYLVYSVALSLIGVIAAIVVFAVYGRGLTAYVRAHRSAPGTYFGWTAWTFILCVVLNGGQALISFVTAMLGG